MSINVLPELKPIKPMCNFNYCYQKPFPMQYRDEITLYEIIYKLTKCNNEIAENIDINTENIDDLYNAIKKLQDWYNKNDLIVSESPVTGNTTRFRISWYGQNQMQTYIKTAAFQGFRAQGQYLKTGGKRFTIPEGFVVHNTLTDSMYGLNSYCWVGNFLAEENGEIVPKITPFVEIIAIDGNTVSVQSTLYTQITTSFNFSAATGCDVLLCSRNGYTRNTNKVVKITQGNNNNTFVLNDVTDLDVGDILLIAPCPHNNYLYLNSTYVEGESREFHNTQDDGRTVLIRGSQKTVDIEEIKTGKVQLLPLKGYVSPLSTGAYVGLHSVFSTSATGTYGLNYGGDSSHIQQYSPRFTKTTTDSDSFTDTLKQVNYLYLPKISMTFSGSLLGRITSASLRIWGWVEP